jgi:hypothetical protein
MYVSPYARLTSTIWVCWQGLSLLCQWLTFNNGRYIAWRLPIFPPLVLASQQNFNLWISFFALKSASAPQYFFFRYLAKFYGCGHVFAGEPQGMFTATRITNPFEIFGVLGFS